jgi:hypothetical protein
MYKVFIAQIDENLKQKLLFGVGGRICKDRVREYYKAKEHIEEAMKDGLPNVALLCMVFGKPRAEVKQLFGKGCWKKLVKTPFSKLKTISETARYFIKQNSEEKSIECFRVLPDCATTILPYQIERMRYGLDAIKYISNNYKGKYKNRSEIRRASVFVEDTIRLCNRFQVEFNLQWSVRRTIEVHDDLAGREREWYADRNKDFNKTAKFDYFNVLTSEFVDDKVPTIKARILANGEEVIQEGIRQKHCVASYTGTCYNNKYIVVSIDDGVIRSTVGIVTSSYYNTNAKELNFSIQQHYASCNKEAPEEHKEFAQKILDILNTDAKLEAVKNIFEKKGD